MTRLLLQLRPWQRHSQVLAVAGTVYVTYGIVAVGTSWDNGRGASLPLAAYLPASVWMTAWLLVGGLALVSTRWPPSSKTWGYTALAGLAACWSSMYAFSTMLGADVGRNFAGTIVWALVSFLWYAISGLVNPDDVPIGG